MQSGVVFRLHLISSFVIRDHEPLKLTHNGGFGSLSVFIARDGEFQRALTIITASRQAGYEPLPVVATQVRRSTRLGVFRQQEENVKWPALHLERIFVEWQIQVFADAKN